MNKDIRMDDINGNDDNTIINNVDKSMSFVISDKKDKSGKNNNQSSLIINNHDNSHSFGLNNI